MRRPVLLLTGSLVSAGGHFGIVHPTPFIRIHRPDNGKLVVHNPDLSEWVVTRAQIVRSA